MANPRSREVTRDAIARALYDDDRETYCARLRAREELEANFLTIYMVLVLGVALLVLATLVVGFGRLIGGEAIEALLSGLGSIVSGAGTVFLERQRREARERHDTVLELLRKHCPGAEGAA